MHWVLVGSGHGHLSLLHELAASKPATVRVTLVSPNARQWYSGMLPGYLAGHYTAAQCQIDLAPLIQALDIHWIPETITGIDADRQIVHLADGGVLQYNLLSVNAGGISRRDYQCLAAARHISLKPFDSFVEGWNSFERSRSPTGVPRVVIIGAGAAGVELAMALAHRFSTLEKPVALCLVGPELLERFPPRVRRIALRELSRSGVEVKLSRVTEVAEQYVRLQSGEDLQCDLSVGATGTAPPSWLAGSGLATDEAGFIEVDKYHQSLSHQGVFAIGDICSRRAAAFQRSGVHAVRAGPVVARNLLACHNDQTLEPYRPRPWTLYILSCGRSYAIANWGPLTLAGRWIWRWKRVIDTRFIARFVSPESKK